MSNCFLATNDFLDSLAVIDKVVTALSTPEALRPSQLPVTNAIGCSTIVLLSGYFESYLKDIVQEYIKEINGLNKPISSIPYEMQSRHYSGGAEALIWASKRDKNLQTTSISQDLSRRLGSLHNNTGYELAWEAFANTKSNPGTETVRSILTGLEIKKTWDEINDLQKQYGRLDTFLGSFIEMRNVCAHTGRHHTPPSAGDIAGYVERFRAMAECIDLLAGLRLERFREAAA